MSGTILIADAVSRNRIALKVKLSAACYDTCVATDVDTALAGARAQVPDLLLVDDALPGGGAIELFRRLAADPLTRAIPVIALCDASGRLPAVRAGADAVLERPVDEFLLLARIRNLMAGGGRPLAGPDTPTVPDAFAALGLAEAPASFAPAPSPKGRLVLVAPDGATVIGWKQALGGHGPFSIEASSAERALNDAAAGRPGDVYLIAADLALPGDGLRLLSELRARPSSRGAAFIIALSDERAALAPVALDLGAGDVLPMSLRDRPVAEEAALRITAQLKRKRAADHRRLAAEAERHWAVTDPLTGLHNRRFAMPRLEAMAAEAERGELAVMVVDLDCFKAINDTYGHAAGDTVLTEVACRLAHVLPPSALLARIGGEEFLIAIPNLLPGGAEAAADGLRRCVAAAPVELPAILGGGQIAVTASIGLARGMQGELANIIMLRADRALLGAKSMGRNRVVAAPLWSQPDAFCGV
ncbi:diguanylate cyclase [Paracoccus suum]|uniref:diguanylate cyclase n=1 Tax=Paracoccus suum TaxID=2259340 RepID=A0A344PL75_9RHOB|nr:diguanylate cyclase [Paracoccus suum]AXC50130.1 diguanylate cyclase [Paracoccus suum]